eukprot:gene19895-39444_t
MGADEAEAATPAPAEAPAEADASARAELYYFFPHELERELIVLRDRSGDVDIALPVEVHMHVFVGMDGKVASISFEGEPPAPALAAQLEAAFGTMEFMPGMRQGKAVPARIKIVIAPHAAIDTKRELAAAGIGLRRGGQDAVGADDAVGSRAGHHGDGVAAAFGAQRGRVVQGRQVGGVAGAGGPFTVVLLQAAGHFAHQGFRRRALALAHALGVVGVGEGRDDADHGHGGGDGQAEQHHAKHGKETNGDVVQAHAAPAGVSDGWAAEAAPMGCTPERSCRSSSSSFSSSRVERGCSIALSASLRPLSSCQVATAATPTASAPNRISPISHA